VGVVVLGALVAGLVLGLSGGGHHGAKQPVLSAPGRLLAYDNGTGRLVFEDVTGTGRVVTREVLNGNPLVSPDGRFVLTDTGNDLFAVGANSVRVLHSPTSSANGQANTPFQPFADHDRLVVAPRPFTSNPGVSLVPRKGGRPVRLGTADDVAGDPAAPAVYVTVGTGRIVSSPQDPSVQIQPDSRVEWREAGHPARVIVTAARLNRFAGLPGNTRLLMSASPSPDGSLVLVSASSLSARHLGTAIAVFTAKGRLVGKLVGPHLGGGYWSSSSNELAYFVGPNRLVLWQPATDQRRAMTVLTSPTSPWGDCVWAPNDDWVTCLGRAPELGGQNKRLLVDLTTEQSEIINAADEPLAWLSK
jgi:hypothetical protein